MSPEEHYAKAEELLEWAANDECPERHFQDRDWLTARAQAHATMALFTPAVSINVQNPFTEVAEALAETHAIVELPKPWMEGSDAEWTDGIITAHIGSGKVRCYLEDGRMTSDDAREIGAGLIAAAAAADRTKENEA